MEGNFVYMVKKNSYKVWGLVSAHKLAGFCVAVTGLFIMVLYTGLFPLQRTLNRLHTEYLSYNSVNIDPRVYQYTHDNKLKVYMYDLPRKFNLGLFNRSGPDQELPWTDMNNLPAPYNTNLNNIRRQHSVEYWMMLDLLDKTRNGKVAVRVHDPTEADVFFVPFFASTSFNTYGVSMRDPQRERDKDLQAEIVRFLWKSPWWRRSKGRDHVLVLHHPNAFRFFKEKLNSSLLVLADFGRFPRNMASLHKDVIAPYSHMVPTFTNDNSSDPFEDRSTLLFFQGRVKRKDDGVVRTQLANVLENQPGVHFEEGIPTNHTVDQAMRGMRESKFCLHPAGDTPSSCRLFDAIVSHCVPVIVSDKIELPYEDDLDYTEFSLFFSAEEATRPGFLLQRLSRVPKKTWMEMWMRLKQVSRHFGYQYPTKEDDAVNMLWNQIRKKVPSIKLAIHRNRRLKIHDWWNCKK